MTRPPFPSLTSYEQFQSYYWYREELKQICKNLGMNFSGTKQELNQQIAAYFKGIIPQKKQSPKRFQVKTTHLTPSTPLLACGFVFNQKFRDFFSEQTGIPNFKFHADMVATVKKVKQEADWNFTLQDLLDVYYGKRDYAKYDNSSCQWNQFLKDFCADPNNALFSNPLKVASLLWGVVRDSTKEKVYTSELVKENAHLVKEYRKKA